MMNLGEEDLKRIVARRDQRFDGRFYFGVKTTRIYCRPVCPAKPKPENIVLFRSASEAERHGYRPCKRCRPDLAPGSKFLDGTLNTVSRALRLIGEQRFGDGHRLADGHRRDASTVGELAEMLGVSERHLRRLFNEHLGASPLDVLTTQRLHFAVQLVQTTALPITDIAFAAGFKSVRRFNEAFRTRFRTAPSALRGKRHADTAAAGLRLTVPVRCPYDWTTTLAYLSRHECFGCECVVDGRYHRFIIVEKGFGVTTVSPRLEKGCLEVEFVNVPLHDVRFVLERLRRLFDTDHNPADLPSSTVPAPGGIRVPGSFDPFETAVSIVLSQRVSTAHAKTALRSLVQRFGRFAGDHEYGSVYEFPTPAVLARAPVEEIRLTRSKADTIRSLAAAVENGHIRFDAPADFADLTDRLLAIRGIGPWTAAMISMRCLGNPDAFPSGDLVVQRALERNLADPAQWRAARAYLTHCLWRDLASTKRM